MKYIIFILTVCFYTSVYGDCITGNCSNGLGTFLYEDGREYSGNWLNGIKHGQGIYRWSTGAEYKGVFKYNKAHGWGIYIYPDGKIKRILFKSSEQVASQWLPRGAFKNEARYGSYTNTFGKYIGWYKGNKYSGYKPHGRGKMIWNDGAIYRGQWFKGRMHGRGEMIWANKNKYKGQWLCGKRTGYGAFFWNDGSYYIGKWKDNFMHGFGKYKEKGRLAIKGLWSYNKIKKLSQVNVK